jgi:hypothetical protein
MKFTQQAGKKHTFGCGHKGILPPSFGQSNRFAWWKKSKKYVARGGVWLCYQCIMDGINKRRRGENGIIGRLKYLLRSAKQNARKNGYIPPSITGENLAKMWLKQNEKCVYCGVKIDILKKRSSFIDHNHKTGKVRGFACGHCNLAEGHLANHSPQRLKQFIKNLYEFRKK